MPIDFVGFTGNRRITAAIPLADDRLSDMLNSVARIVLRDAVVDDLVEDARPAVGDVTLPVGDLVAVVGTGRRGSESQRRRTVVRGVRIGLGRYVVSGNLHLAATVDGAAISVDPAALLAGRDILVPITAATITYDRANVTTTEHHETILVNRARAVWVDVDASDEGGEPGLAADEPEPAHPTYLKDFTGSVAD